MFTETIEVRDSCTRGHCRRVRVLTMRIALCIGLAEDSIAALETGALLHDIGKIGIPEPLLYKSGRLGEREMESFRRRTVIGEDILKAVEVFKPCLKIIRHHHEWFDGTGYPDGISGANIDLSARIVALSELNKGKESQFDPLLVDLFIDNELYRPITS